MVRALAGEMSSAGDVNAPSNHQRSGYHDTGRSWFSAVIRASARSGPPRQLVPPRTKPGARRLKMGRNSDARVVRILVRIAWTVGLGAI